MYRTVCSVVHVSDALLNGRYNEREKRGRRLNYPKREKKRPKKGKAVFGPQNRAPRYGPNSIAASDPLERSLPSYRPTTMNPPIAIVLVVTALMLTNPVSGRAFSGRQRQDVADLNRLRDEARSSSSAEVVVPPALLLRTGDGPGDQVYVPLPCQSEICE